MKDFTYKEYTEEETKIYEMAMDKIMKGLKEGLSFHECCNSLTIEDEELKGFITDDALKIVIADMHYNRGLSLEHVADTIQLPMDVINKANEEMMEDVEITTIEMSRMSNPLGQTGTA